MKLATSEQLILTPTITILNLAWKRFVALKIDNWFPSFTTNLKRICFNRSR